MGTHASCCKLQPPQQHQYFTCPSTTSSHHDRKNVPQPISHALQRRDIVSTNEVPMMLTTSNKSNKWTPVHADSSSACRQLMQMHCSSTTVPPYHRLPLIANAPYAVLMHRALCSDWAPLARHTIYWVPAIHARLGSSLVAIFVAARCKILLYCVLLFAPAAGWWQSTRAPIS
jgi:hypothetical protein